MQDVLIHLGQGFLTVFQPVNIFVLMIGLVLGLLVAVLPGLTLVMGVVLALPFTYKMGITPAVILLTAMYVTGTYGGAFTAILFRIPGEPIDVPLLWDGYEMARKGEPAKALGWTLFAALAGGLVAAVVMVAASEPVAKVALSFSAPEYFALVFFGLASVVCLGGGSQVNAFISLFIGLLIASVGVDGTYGTERFSFGIDTLRDGIEYLGVMVGAYGLGEVLSRLEQRLHVADPGEGRQDRNQVAVGVRVDGREGLVRPLLDPRHPDRHRAGRRRHHRLVPVIRRGGAVRAAAQGDGHRRA